MSYLTDMLKEAGKPLIPGYVGKSAYQFKKSLINNIFGKNMGIEYPKAIVSSSALLTGLLTEYMTLGLYCHAVYLGLHNNLSSSFEIGLASSVMREVIYHGCNTLKEKIENSKQ